MTTTATSHPIRRRQPPAGSFLGRRLALEARLAAARTEAARAAVRAELASLARERADFIARNVGLAFGLVRNQLSFYHAVRRYGLDDAEGIALLKLTHAADWFDPAREFAFSTYACHAMRREVLIEALRQPGVVRLPTDPERAAIRPATAGDVARARAARTVGVWGGGADGGAWDLDPGDGGAAAEQVERRVDDAECLSRLAPLLASLPSRTRAAVEGRYMHGRRLADIGRDIGVSKERVRQLAQQGLRLLRVWAGVGDDAGKKLPRARPGRKPRQEEVAR